jgi:Nas2 N_terminal domain
MLFESNDDNEETRLRKTLASLDVRRQSMETEADGIISELTTSSSPDVPPMGIDTPLIDDDGYPRHDVDVYRARTLRHRLAVLKTDHKSIVNEIEKLLIELAKMKVRLRCYFNDVNVVENDGGVEGQVVFRLIMLSTHSDLSLLFYCDYFMY